MATKKSGKEQKKREQEPRKGVATVADLEEKARIVRDHAQHLDALAKEFKRRGLVDGVQVDGWQKFKRSTTELKEFCHAVEYFMKLASD